jgi:hypothetical protein
MYKQLFNLLFNLISVPEKTWKGLGEESALVKFPQDIDNEKFYKSYLYPIIGIIALLSFLGVFLYERGNGLEAKEISGLALKMVIRECITYFAGFYLTAYGIFAIISKYFKQEIKKQLCERFAGYSSAVTYVVAMIYALFPALFFVRIFIFYAIYTVWVGATHYLEIKEEYLTKFTIFAGILIVFSPLIIQKIFSLIMPGL